MAKIKFDECLYFSAARVNRIVAKMSDQTFKRIGLSSTAAFILMYLGAEDQLNPSAIAEELSLDRSTVTRFLDKLETQGYLNRVSDGRTVNITLTQQGLETQDQLKKLWAQLNDQYQQALGVENEKQLRELLNQDFQILKK